jgi:hypothetical protein
MGDKRKWAKSTNGPDETDLEALMRAIGVMHSARVAFTVQPLGTGLNGGVSILVTASFDLLPGSSLPPIVDVESKWPNSIGREFLGEIFQLLYQLDFRISEVYKNEELWK